MRVSLKAIKLPTGLLSARQIDEVIERALDIDANAVKVDYRQTTQTWKHKPEFKIVAGKYYRLIDTDDAVYGYVDRGTKVRRAIMSPGFRSKTVPNQMRVRAGHGGVVFISKKISRPGIEARNFTKMIRKKWDDEFVKSIQRAIASVVK